MSLNRSFAVALRQFYLIRGSLTRVVPLFVWVGIDIVLWGFITRFLNNVADAPVNFVPVFLGAVLLWDFLVRIMQGTTMAFMEDSWSRNFLNMFTSPLKIPEYLFGLIISSIATSSVGLVVMILLSTFVFGLSFLSYGAILVPFMLILFLFGIALGILGCAIMLRFGPAAEWFVWPIPALVAPFAGVFYPVATLPHWMQAISHALPPSYVFESMRAIVMGGVASSEALAMGIAMAAGYIVLACIVFMAVYRYAVKVGLIARYSAESVS